MTKRLTTQDLEAIRKRAEAATEGPWKWCDNERVLSSVKDGKYVGQAVSRTESEVWFDAWDEDLEFIRAAREDIPALLAEVERLRAENAMFEQAIAEDDATKERLHTAYEDMTSIALWSTRRLSNKQHKDFAYDAIDRNLGREVERV